jgi:hypothetical protein
MRWTLLVYIPDVLQSTRLDMEVSGVEGCTNNEMDFVVLKTEE